MYRRSHSSSRRHVNHALVRGHHSQCASLRSLFALIRSEARTGSASRDPSAHSPLGHVDFGRDDSTMRSSRTAGTAKTGKTGKTARDFYGDDDDARFDLASLSGSRAPSKAPTSASRHGDNGGFRGYHTQVRRADELNRQELRCRADLGRHQAPTWNAYGIGRGSVSLSVSLSILLRGPACTCVNNRGRVVEC